jgi:hypothetical protein
VHLCELNKHNMYTLIDDVMSLAWTCKANATFYLMTKDCWTSLSPDSQKAWDLLLKQDKIKILNDTIKRTTKQAGDSKQWSANVHEQEEDESPKIEANVHDGKKVPTRKPILKPSVKQQVNHVDHMGIIDLLDTPNPLEKESSTRTIRSSNEGNSYDGFDINSMLQCKSKPSSKANTQEVSQ